MTARERFTIRLRRTLRHMTPAHITKASIAKRTIQKFADKVGLVYFGYVDQRDDDHRLVRGHTVSQTHVDSNYCVGTVRGYDVALVLRNDVIRSRASHNGVRCHWLIYTIDLHTKRDIPHMYIGHRSRDFAFAASFEQLYPLAIGGTEPYPHAFLHDYTVYGIATHTIDIEHTITPYMATVIVERFHGVSFEIQENTLYLYVENERPTETQLETMLSNGLWLAEAIDVIYAQSNA